MDSGSAVASLLWPSEYCILSFLDELLLLRRRITAQRLPLAGPSTHRRNPATIWFDDGNIILEASDFLPPVQSISRHPLCTFTAFLRADLSQAEQVSKTKPVTGSHSL